MYNVYLLPVCDSDGCYISCTHALSMTDAEEKFIDELVETYDIDEDINHLSDFSKYRITVGDIYDKEEF